MINTAQIFDISTHRDDPDGLERKIDEMSQLRLTIEGILPTVLCILPTASSHRSKNVFVDSDHQNLAPA